MTSLGRPILPPEAEQEILSLLFEGMGIESAEIAAILKKHGVSGDMEALQDSYRKRLGQRLMASLRDESGRREVLATGKGRYVVLGGLWRPGSSSSHPPPHPGADQWTE